MKKNMSFKIIATVGLWAAIGLTACKAPQLSPDGERAVLPEGRQNLDFNDGSPEQNLSYIQSKFC